MGGVAASPFVGRLVDRMVPWYATLVASVVCLAVYALQTAAAGVSVAAVIIVCFGMDIFRQTQQVSISTRVLGLDPLARARMNAVLIIAVSCLPSARAQHHLRVGSRACCRSFSDRLWAQLSARLCTTAMAGAPRPPSTSPGKASVSSFCWCGGLTAPGIRGLGTRADSPGGRMSL